MDEKDKPKNCAKVINNLADNEKIMIFCNTKLRCTQLNGSLYDRDIESLVISGTKDLDEKMRIKDAVS